MTLYISYFITAVSTLFTLLMGIAIVVRDFTLWVDEDHKGGYDFYERLKLPVLFLLFFLAGDLTVLIRVTKLILDD